ncbi:NAD(P)/FAD-dependent oxidoreductase [Thioclava kandeliae]|uniref:FAD-binding oxidoreductase n=1 Tax=Thioclava kandeliae TaxID=3070818 RepID=A0ABV1SGW7_9RHOB
MTSGLRVNPVSHVGDQVTVRGAGVFGLACAFEMARRGARVRVIDIHGVGAGASGGTVGALAPHVPENWNPKKQFQLESLLMADAFWSDAARIGGGDAGYARIGRLQPLADEAQIVRARERGENAKTLWQGKAVWEVVPMREFGPLGFESPSGYVVHDTLSARACPRATGDALARAIIALGGEVLIGEAEETGPVLHATGAAGLQDLGLQLGKNVGAGIKGQAAVFAFDAGDMPQLYAESLHIIPHSNGTVAIGSTSERAYDNAHRTDDQLEALIARTRQICPELAGAEVVDRWAGLRPRAKSRAPMLGAWPDRAGHFIANGGFKIGFGMAPKVAQVMADLILENRTQIPQGFHVEDNL